MARLRPTTTIRDHTLRHLSNLFQRHFHPTIHTGCRCLGRKLNGVKIQIIPNCNHQVSGKGGMAEQGSECLRFCGFAEGVGEALERIPLPSQRCQWRDLKFRSELGMKWTIFHIGVGKGIIWFAESSSKLSQGKFARCYSMLTFCAEAVFGGLLTSPSIAWTIVMGYNISFLFRDQRRKSKDGNKFAAKMACPLQSCQKCRSSGTGRGGIF